MKLMPLTLLALMTLSLSACVAEYPDRWHDRDDDRYYYNNGRYHDDRGYWYYRDRDDYRRDCPPGHAKKGWC